LSFFGVTRALESINNLISRRLRGMDARDQQTVDHALIELDGTRNKSRLGGNATVAVSMAVAHAAALAAGLPLYKYLSGTAARLPLPEVQIFGGGAHAGGRLDIQDFMIIPLRARSFDEALEMVAGVYYRAGEILSSAGRLRGVADEGGYWPEFNRNEDALETLVRAIEAAGLEPGADMGIAIDVAASQFRKNGTYTLARDSNRLDSDGLCDLILNWISKYPIVSVEDPLAENDERGFAGFTKAVPGRALVVGDDLLVTSAENIKHAAAAGLCNAALIKPNQAGTLTEARAAFDAAHDAGWPAIVSARSGESEDVTIVHLAVGWGAEQLKVGSFARSERMVKWNEALRIEQALGSAAKLAEFASPSH
jgi:enolase